MSDADLEVPDEAAFAEFIRGRGPKCLIVVRHGETAWNVEGRLQGQKDVPLNSRGRGQASAAAQFLGDVPLVRIHSSTLQRCQETARTLAEGNVSRPEVSSTDLLRETALGILEGEFKARQSTQELTRLYQAFSSDEIHFRIPGGENLHDVAARVQRFFVDHAKQLDGPGVHLIVGHRNVNKMILKHLLGLSFEQGLRVEHEHPRLYLYFDGPKELWSCWLEEGTAAHLTRGYATTVDDGAYA